MPRRRRNRYASWDRELRAATWESQNRCRLLLVIDNAPLQAAAWAELGRARRRLEKVTADVHRHEEVDTPAFRAWLAREFPRLLSELRELAQELEAKGRLVQGIETESFFSGRPVATIWREWHENGDRPPEPPPAPRSHPSHNPENGGNGHAEGGLPDLEEMLRDEMERMFGEQRMDDDGPDDKDFREFARDVFGLESGRPSARETSAARDLYRRLVLQLHPDRGGAWTAARAGLWDQVQQAWAARDADWLARLEAEWEASTDLLGPHSAVGRLRAALKEIEAARRDAEKKVRAYRTEGGWRFSLQKSTDRLYNRVRVELEHDRQKLQAELENLRGIIAQWQRRAERRNSRKRRAQEQFDLF